MRKRATPAALALVLLLSVTPDAGAQQTAARAISLQDAITLAAKASEEVVIAESGTVRARGEQLRARSEYFPQLFGTAGYTRTLRSEFSGVAQSDSAESPGGEQPGECGAFTPNASLPITERLDSLERAVACQSNQNGFDLGGLFQNLPFGRANQWNFGLQASQAIPVLGGRRIRSQVGIANAGRTAAEVELRSARAQLVLDVTQAYFDALLAARLVGIAEATLQQSETTLSHVRLAAEVGDQPEFELLRAQVSRDNQRPIVIQRRAERDLALIRLKQMLDIPLNEPVTLVTALADSELPPVTRQVSVNQPGDTSVASRAPVQQAAEQVRVQELLQDIAKAQRLPSITLNSQYGRVAYPESGLPSWSDFRSNWTVGAALQIPIFTGGRIRGDELVASANLTEMRARYDIVRELAALDARDAVERLRAAESALAASAGTVEQAERAASIAQVRYTEGVSTQLELNDARILLQQAQANRAVAARDFQIARTRVALLADLPIGAGQTNGGSGTMSTPAQMQPALPQAGAPARPPQPSGQTPRPTQANVTGNQ